MTEEEMRQALFGKSETAGPTGSTRAQLHRPDDQPLKAPAKRAGGRNFVPRLIVTLRVGNEFEGLTELFTHQADTLSQLQAELDALKAARKKYKYIELVSIEAAK